MALNDWEWSWEGDNGTFTFGGDQPHGITSIEGLEGGAIKLDIVSRPGASGAWVFAGFEEELHLLFSGDFVSDPMDVFTYYQGFKDSLAPQPSAGILTFKFPGLDEGTIAAKVGRKSFPLTMQLGNTGYGEWAAEFITEDPTITFVPAGS